MFSNERVELHNHDDSSNFANSEFDQDQDSDFISKLKELALGRTIVGKVVRVFLGLSVSTSGVGTALVTAKIGEAGHNPLDVLSRSIRLEKSALKIVWIDGIAEVIADVSSVERAALLTTLLDLVEDYGLERVIQNRAELQVLLFGSVDSSVAQLNQIVLRLTVEEDSIDFQQNQPLRYLQEVRGLGEWRLFSLAAATDADTEVGRIVSNDSRLDQVLHFTQSEHPAVREEYRQLTIKSAVLFHQLLVEEMGLSMSNEEFADLFFESFQVEVPYHDNQDPYQVITHLLGQMGSSTLGQDYLDEVAILGSNMSPEHRAQSFQIHREFGTFVFDSQLEDESITDSYFVSYFPQAVVNWRELGGADEFISGLIQEDRVPQLTTFAVLGNSERFSFYREQGFTNEEIMQLLTTVVTNTEFTADGSRYLVELIEWAESYGDQDLVLIYRQILEGNFPGNLTLIHWLELTFSTLYFDEDEEDLYQNWIRPIRENYPSQVENAHMAYRLDRLEVHFNFNNFFEDDWSQAFFFGDGQGVRFESVITRTAYLLYLQASANGNQPFDKGYDFITRTGDRFDDYQSFTEGVSFESLSSQELSLLRFFIQEDLRLSLLTVTNAPTGQRIIDQSRFSFVTWQILGDGSTRPDNSEELQTRLRELIVFSSNYFNVNSDPQAVALFQAILPHYLESDMQSAELEELFRQLDSAEGGHELIRYELVHYLSQEKVWWVLTHLEEVNQVYEFLQDQFQDDRGLYPTAVILARVEESQPGYLSENVETVAIFIEYFNYGWMINSAWEYLDALPEDQDFFRLYTQFIQVISDSFPNRNESGLRFDHSSSVSRLLEQVLFYGYRGSDPKTRLISFMNAVVESEHDGLHLDDYYQADVLFLVLRGIDEEDAVVMIEELSQFGNPHYDERFFELATQSNSLQELRTLFNLFLISEYWNQAQSQHNFLTTRSGEYSEEGFRVFIGENPGLDPLFYFFADTSTIEQLNNERRDFYYVFTVEDFNRLNNLSTYRSLFEEEGLPIELIRFPDLLGRAQRMLSSASSTEAEQRAREDIDFVLEVIGQFEDDGIRISPDDYFLINLVVQLVENPAEETIGFEHFGQTYLELSPLDRVKINWSLAFIFDHIHYGPDAEEIIATSTVPQLLEVMPSVYSRRDNSILYNLFRMYPDRYLEIYSDENLLDVADRVYGYRDVGVRITLFDILHFLRTDPDFDEVIEMLFTVDRLLLQYQDYSPEEIIEIIDILALTAPDLELEDGLNTFLYLLDRGYDREHVSFVWSQRFGLSSYLSSFDGVTREQSLSGSVTRIPVHDIEISERNLDIGYLGFSALYINSGLITFQVDEDQPVLKQFNDEDADELMTERSMSVSDFLAQYSGHSFLVKYAEIETLQIVSGEQLGSSFDGSDDLASSLVEFGVTMMANVNYVSRDDLERHDIRDFLLRLSYGENSTSVLIFHEDGSFELVLVESQDTLEVFFDQNPSVQGMVVIDIGRKLVLRTDSGIIGPSSEGSYNHEVLFQIPLPTTQEETQDRARNKRVSGRQKSDETVVNLEAGIPDKIDSIFDIYKLYLASKGSAHMDKNSLVIVYEDEELLVYPPLLYPADEGSKSSSVVITEYKGKESVFEVTTDLERQMLDVLLEIVSKPSSS